jgi:WD40 repeat protein
MSTADPTKFKIAKTARVKGIAFCITQLPGTQRLVFGSSDFKVYELDLATEKPQPVVYTGEGHQSYVTGIARAADQIVTGSYDGRLIWWDAQKREPVRSINAHEKWIRDVISSPDGKVIASVADDMQCKLWDAATGNPLHTLVGHQAMTPHHFPSMLYAVAFSRDGQLLATGDKVGHIAVWDVASGKQVSELEAPVHRRHPQPGVLGRWQIDRSGRSRHHRKHRSSRRSLASRDLRLGHQAASPGNLRHEIQRPCRADRVL